LPTNALLGFFIADAILSLLCIALLLRARRKSRGGVRSLIHYAMLASFVCFGQALALYLENGWNIAYSIMVMFMWASSVLWGAEFATLIVLPMFSINVLIQNRVRIYVRVAYTSLLLINFIALTALASTSGDATAFNKTMVAYQFLLISSCSFHAVIIIHYGNQLKKRLEETDNFVARESIRFKIIGMKSAAAQIVLGQSTGIIASIVYLTIGSVPYLWIVTFINMLFTPISFTRATLDLLKAYVPPSSPPDNTSVKKTVGAADLGKLPGLEGVDSKTSNFPAGLRNSDEAKSEAGGGSSSKREGTANSAIVAPASPSTIY
jgi:hypothetical protein